MALLSAIAAATLDGPLAVLEFRGMRFRGRRKTCAGRLAISVPSLLLRSAISEARTISDPAGNAKFGKGSQGGRRLRARDDSAGAAILAVAAEVRQPAAPTPRWRYHEMAG